MTLKQTLKQYLVTRNSSLTGKKHTFYLWFTQQQWEEIQPFLRPELPKGERRLEEILPDHSPYTKEFLLSGITREERALSETPFTSEQATEILCKYPPKTA
jgi:hypothetical protein